MTLIDFELPENLIATHPSEKRDESRMMVYDRSSKQTFHAVFSQLPSFLNQKHLLLLNNTKVDPKRLRWSLPNGREEEILILQKVPGQNLWHALISGRGLKVHHSYEIRPGVSFQIQGSRSKGPNLIQFNVSDGDLTSLLKKEGELPLPPYIVKKRKQKREKLFSEADRERYQTVYSSIPGSVAAPTAGLHFTDTIFQQLKQQKVDWDFVNLSVGYGTFEPLQNHHFETGKLHQEYCSVPKPVADKIRAYKAEHKKVIAVGTTTARTLETFARKGYPDNFEGPTDLFIQPGFEFKVVDGMITNFHLPKSSLLLLVAAFLGQDGEQEVLQIYRQAIEQKYRFFSYGDCMLIL